MLVISLHLIFTKSSIIDPTTSCSRLVVIWALLFVAQLDRWIHFIKESGDDLLRHCITGDTSISLFSYSYAFIFAFVFFLCFRSHLQSFLFCGKELQCEFSLYTVNNMHLYPLCPGPYSMWALGVISPFRWKQVTLFPPSLVYVLGEERNITTISL